MESKRVSHPLSSWDVVVFTSKDGLVGRDVFLSPNHSVEDACFLRAMLLTNHNGARCTRDLEIDTDPVYPASLTHASWKSWKVNWGMNQRGIHKDTVSIFWPFSDQTLYEKRFEEAALSKQWRGKFWQDSLKTSLVINTQKLEGIVTYARPRGNPRWGQEMEIWDFPGGPVAKTPRSQFRRPGFSPWSGN